MTAIFGLLCGKVVFGNEQVWRKCQSSVNSRLQSAARGSPMSCGSTASSAALGVQIRCARIRCAPISVSTLKSQPIKDDCMHLGKLVSIVFFLGILSGNFVFGQYIISTIAGGAPPPTPSVALGANLGYPTNLAADSQGNVYFNSLNCVFKLDVAGNVTRVAGNSQGGYSGDGGPATSAQLQNNPGGLAVNSAGEIFIADYWNLRVRKISASGIITTVAGTGAQGYSGDGGLAINADLGQPTSVAPDAQGNLYIADSGNLALRRVSPGGVITTVPSVNPTAMAIDANGNLFFTNVNSVARLTPTGTVGLVAGTGTAGFSGDGGPATKATLRSPSGVALDAAGNLYIADFLNNRIRMVNPSGIITTVAGNGINDYKGDGQQATLASVGLPTGVAVDSSGNLLIASAQYGRIRKVSPAGVITTVAGTGLSSSDDGVPATSAPFGGPAGLALDASGNLYFADSTDYRVRQVSPSGIVTWLAGVGCCAALGDGGPARNAQLSSPAGVAVDAAGNLFIADTYNNLIRKVAPNDTITTVAGNGNTGYSGDGGPATSAALNQPIRIAVDSKGNLLIADSGNNRIREVSPSGTITTIAGTGQPASSGDGGPATSAAIDNPYGVAVDSAGDVFIAEADSGVIRKISPTGVISTVAGSLLRANGFPFYFGDGGPAINAGLDDPECIAVDGPGNLFIAESGANRVRKVSTNGTITTIAGYGSSSYSGDGGPGTIASLSPACVAVDSAGNVYVSDKWNRAIRLLTPSGNTSPAPSFTANGVVDAASYKAAVAPGGIASLFGTNLGLTASASTIPLPQLLGNATVVINGYSAPLFYVSPTQINFQVPWELARLSPLLKTVSSVVISGSGTSAAQTINVKSVSPGIFSANSSGSGQGVVTNAATGQLAVAATPVARGQYVTIYCSGLGQVNGAPTDGGASGPVPLSQNLSTPIVMIGGVQATVSYSGLTPGLVGLYQVNALVPATVNPGSAVSLMLTMNGVASNTVSIAVQ